MTVIERERVIDPKREEQASLLEAAALEMEVRGMCREAFVDAHGRVCAMGAIFFASGGWDGDKWTGFEYGRSLLEAGKIPIDWTTVAVWNNTQAKDAAEVAFLLRWRAQEVRDGR